MAAARLFNPDHGSPASICLVITFLPHRHPAAVPALRAAFAPASAPFARSTRRFRAPFTRFRIALPHIPCPRGRALLRFLSPQRFWRAPPTPPLRAAYPALARRLPRPCAPLTPPLRAAYPALARRLPRPCAPPTPPLRAAYPALARRLPRPCAPLTPPLRSCARTLLRHRKQFPLPNLEYVFLLYAVLLSRGRCQFPLIIYFVNILRLNTISLDDVHNDLCDFSPPAYVIGPKNFASQSVY
ncbi:hypothetical protein C8R47DRAFT_1230807 [Mycena vitilis]|nr:hypothetical protein C8R47DRAFT_1230807 [Mycena vitilis]